MLSYYLLRSLSDNPILLPKGQIEVITGGFDVLNFLLRPKIGIQDGSLNEKPPKLLFNFCEPGLLPAIHRSFLEEIISQNDANQYMWISRLFCSGKEEIEDTGFLLFKCKDVIYTRAGKNSFFKQNDTPLPVYIPNGNPYITHIPSYEIPVYGSQIGELIVREDLMTKIIYKKVKKLYINKLKIHPPIDGFEFRDSISLH